MPAVGAASAARKPVESLTGVLNMFGPIGMPELIVIFLVALLVFGPRKLPELG